VSIGSPRTQKEHVNIMNSIHDELRRLGFVRPREGRLLGGVLAGIGRRFGLDPWPTRIAVVALFLTVPGSQVLLYPVMWILMPTETSDTAPVADGFEPAVKPAPQV
jgi:phage shock protein PspC (stress-responsive transcriptional regulator)